MTLVQLDKGHRFTEDLYPVEVGIDLDSCDLRFMLNWKIDRVCYETLRMSRLVQFFRLGSVRIGADRNLGPEDNPYKVTRSVVRLLHKALSVINIFNDHYTGHGAKMQIPQFVARG